LNRIIFFTLPPLYVSYPFILINANNPALSYIARHRKHIKAVLIDSGIEIFKHGYKEYPESAKVRLKKQIILYERVRRYRIPQIWVTIPDYPDDYTPRQCWLSGEITNIERTHWNILKAIDDYSDIPWVIPVQGHFEEPRSILRAIDLLEAAGILKKYNVYGIANICTEEKVNLIFRTLQIARIALKDKWIHAFGIKLNSLRRVHSIINSFDSLAWTKPHSRTLKQEHNHSAKNMFERMLFFFSWYLQYLRITGQMRKEYANLEELLYGDNNSENKARQIR